MVSNLRYVAEINIRNGKFMRVIKHLRLHCILFDARGDCVNESMLNYKPEHDASQGCSLLAQAVS